MNHPPTHSSPSARPGRRLFVLSAVAALLAAPPTATRAAGAGGVDCRPRDGLQFICGQGATEEIAAIPGSRWLIAGNLNVGQPAPILRVDRRARRMQAAWPDDALPARRDARLPADCTGPPDPATLSTSGLALRPGPRGIHRLFAVNHGDRKAIEVFDVETRGSRPRLRWVGCVPMPAGTLPNAVTALPGEGFAVISFHDPEDPLAWDRMARGEDTGRVFEWQPGPGLRELPDSRMSGGNGIAVSADGTTLYASAWSGSRLVVLSRTGGARREIPLPFLPDNLHRLEDGRLLVGGQRTTARAVGDCHGPKCPQPWLVARIDPRTGAVDTLVEGPGNDLVDYACGAERVDGTLYVTVRGDHRLVVVPYGSGKATR